MCVMKYLRGYAYASIKEQLAQNKTYLKPEKLFNFVTLYKLC